MTAKKQLLGHTFGRLTVVAPAASRPGGAVRWECRCECGGSLTVLASSLLTGNTASCGCLRRERTRDRSITHGAWQTSEYAIWSNIVQRCTNPKHRDYADYGGRGITVCDAWRGSFESFFADMGSRPSKRHSIDRIENSAGYSPGNCRWATGSEQTRNTRRNRIVTHAGEALTVVEWSERTGISQGRIKQRLDSGWSPARALTTPPRVAGAERGGA